VANREDLKSLVKETMQSATGTDVKLLSGGRVAFWNDFKKVVVIYNPNAVDNGTVFAPANGRTYFSTLQ
jgi:hypothetical protein